MDAKVKGLCRGPRLIVASRGPSEVLVRLGPHSVGFHLEGLLLESGLLLLLVLDLLLRHCLQRAVHRRRLLLLIPLDSLGFLQSLEWEAAALVLELLLHSWTRRCAHLGVSSTPGLHEELD